MQFLASNAQTAGIWQVRAGDHFDQGGFPRSIFAQQRMNLARLQLERHTFQCSYRAEGFFYSAKL